MRDKFANERRTKLMHDPGDLNIEDLIDDEEMVITITRAGYLKAVSADAFRTQGRGGRGVQGAKLKEEDLVHEIVHTTAHAHLRAHEIPIKERNARGTPAVNLLPLEPGETVQAIIEAGQFADDEFLLFATKAGQVKKTALSEYDKSRREGFIAINLNAGDELVRVIRTGGSDELLLISRSGTGIRFAEGEVRSMGRSAAGVRGMRLKAGDELVSCDVAREDVDLLVVTDAGYGKRTKLEHFHAQARGGQGVRAIKLTQRRGRVVAAIMAALDDEILIVSSAGVVIRTAVREIAAQGRDATGVRVMNLDAGQTVAAVAPVTAGGE